MSPDIFIALLRGINAGDHNQVPMPELRSLCADLGWENVQSYIQSGSLVFKAGATSPSLETELERAIMGRFGLSTPVIVRAAAGWPAYVAGNPIYFKPGGAFPLLQFPLSEQNGQVVPLQAIWGNFAAEIRERLYETPTIQAGFDLLKRLLLARLGEPPYGLDVVQYAIAEIAR